MGFVRRFEVPVGRPQVEETFMPSIRGAVLVVMAGVLSLVLLGCDEAQQELTGTPDIEGIDREAILNELEDVRQILTESAIPADSISAVEFRDGVLRATVSDQVHDEVEADRLCREMQRALEMTDLRIELLDASGSVVTSCGS
jgi:hypothetical protein